MVIFHSYVSLPEGIRNKNMSQPGTTEPAEKLRRFQDGKKADVGDCLSRHGSQISSCSACGRVSENRIPGNLRVDHASCSQSAILGISSPSLDKPNWSLYYQIMVSLFAVDHHEYLPRRACPAAGSSKPPK